MIRKIILFALVYLMISATYAQELKFEVATWYGFKQAAICYTFDDGCANQFAKARPIFDSAGFPMTLFTVTNWTSNWPVLKEMAQKGHEIASHSVTHPNFGQVNAENQDAELANSKNIIEQKVGMPCLTHAYPYCVKAIDSIIQKYYISARGCQGYIEKSTPDDYYNVSSVIVGNLGAIKSYADFKSYFKQAAAKNGWLVFLIHGIDNDGGYSPIPSLELQKSVLYLVPRTPKYWVTTFKAATQYSKERNAVNITTLSITDSLYVLNVTDSLPDSLYYQPLTLRCLLPKQWPSAVVNQGEKPVFSRIVRRDTSIYIEFDVIPNGGEVQVIKKTTPVVPEVDSLPPDDEDPIINPGTNITNPATGLLKVRVLMNRLQISWPAETTSRFWKVSVSDSLGRLILVRNVYGERECLVDLPAGMKAGVYHVVVSNTQRIYRSSIVM